MAQSIAELLQQDHRADIHGDRTRHDDHSQVAIGDDRPPEYEQDDLPGYERNCSVDQIPHHAWVFRQFDRKLMTITPLGAPPDASTYRVQTRKGLSLFSKKPDMTLFRIDPERMLVSGGGGGSGEEIVATMGFDDSGPLPYMPRAYIAPNSSSIPTTTSSTPPTASRKHKLEARNFSDWSMPRADGWGSRVIWRTRIEPNGLITLDLDAEPGDVFLGRFVFSEFGTLASGGAPVGRLEVPLDGAAYEAVGGGVETVMCGFLIALANYRRMGRHHRNSSSGAAEAGVACWGTRIGSIGSSTFSSGSLLAI